MTPDELKSWLTSHGEEDHRATSQVGQTIIFAKDGSRVVLTQLTPDSFRVDDMFEKGAPADVGDSAVTSPAPDASAATPASSGGVSISQADLEAKARANPNLVYQGQKIIDKTVTQFGIPKSIRVPVVTWIDKKTGQTLTAEVEPGGGSYTVTYDGIDEKNKETKPSNASAEWHTEGTPDGNGGTDNSRPIMVRTVNGQRETRSPTGAELKDWNEAQQRSRNPGGKSDAEVAAETKDAETKARQTRLDETAEATRATTARTAAAAEQRAAAAANRIPNPDVPGGFLERGTDNIWRPVKTEGVPDKEAAIPAGVPPFVPDESLPDYGLSAYNEQLQELRRQGKLTYQQGKDIIAQAGKQVELTDARSARQATQASTTRSQDITQRGQDINEVASRRGDANAVYRDVSKASDDMALKMMGGSGGLAAQAFLSALDLAQSNTREQGGFRDVPPVDPALMMATRGAPASMDPATAATQITMHPSGHVEVSPPGVTPPSATPVAASQLGQGQDLSTPPAGQAAAPVGDLVIITDQWGNQRQAPRAALADRPGGTDDLKIDPYTPGSPLPPGTTPYNQPQAMAGPDPYVTAIRPPQQSAQFQPDIAALRAQFPGASDDEIRQAVDEHMAEMGGAAA